MVLQQILELQRYCQPLENQNQFQCPRQQQLNNMYVTRQEASGIVDGSLFLHLQVIILVQ